MSDTEAASLTPSNAPPGGLTAPVVRGGRWLFLATTVTYVLRFLRGLLLMPLLDPKDFGLFFYVLVTVNVMRVFSETGVANIAVQRDDGHAEPVLMTAWWINVIRGVLLAGLLVIVAPMLTRVLDAQARLTSLLRLVALVFLTEGFQSAGMITAVRRLAFNRIAVVQQGSAFIGIGVSVLLAWLYHDVIALVIGEMAAGATLLMLSYLLVPVRPRLTLVPRLARELWGLGKFLYLTQVFVFLLQRGDHFVVGRLLGEAKLGVYGLAYSLGNLPSQLVGQVVNRVMFPAYAKIKGEPQRLKRSLMRAQRFVVIIAVPACIALIALAPAMQAYGGREDGVLRYVGLALPLQLFAVGVFFACLNALNVSLLTALGRPGRVTRITLMQLVLWLALIVPMIRWQGIVGAATITLLQAPAWMMLAIDNGRLIGGGLREQLRNQLFVLPAAAAMGAVSTALWMLLGERIFVYAGAVVVLGPAAFMGTLLLTARASLAEFMTVIRQATGFAPSPPPPGEDQGEGA